MRLLGLVFGNTTFAVSTVLSAYMAGLGFGSYFISIWAQRWKWPLRTYGALEIGVGVYAALTPLLMMLVQKIYVLMAPQGDLSTLLVIRVSLSFLVVFIPTFFMGGTLPVLVRFFMTKNQSFGSITAQLYSLNTLGAVCGTVLAGFLFLPFMGVSGTLALCVALNIGIGLLALYLSRELEEGDVTGPESISKKVKQGLWMPLALFISGIAAMLYEVSWTRILATVLGSSTYAFTIMLATFLLGIALGSAFYKKWLSHRPPSILGWGYLQIGIAASSLAVLPLFPWVNLAVVRLYGLTVGSPNWMLFLMSLICLLLMFVPAFCFGALFPMSVALYVRSSTDLSRKVGFLYLWNTTGNIIGSLAAGFFLIPLIGIQRTILAAVVMGSFLAAVAAGAGLRRIVPSVMAIVSVLGLVMVSVWQGVNGWDVRLLTSGLNIHAPSYNGQKTAQILSSVFDQQILFYREGLNSIVSVGQEGDKRYLKVNGKTDASTMGDMATQMLLGHLPHLLHPAPKRSLVIGFGSGTTLAAALVHPVDRVDCVEIEPAVLEAAPLFDEVNSQAYKDPRAHILINDGRNHLLMEKGKYDVIISEPSNPWMAGVSYLFTKEFYQLVDRKMETGGVFCQWIHAYSIAPDDFWMVIATMRSVFGHATLWRTTADDYLIIATREPFRYPAGLIDSRFGTFPKLRRDMEPFDIRGAASLLARYQLGEDVITRSIQDKRVNTDDRLPLEFSTPKTLYDTNTDLITGIAKTAQVEPLAPMSTDDQTRSQSPEFLVELADGYMGIKNYRSALRYYQAAAQQVPDHPDALTGIGRVMIMEGKHLQAIAVLEKVKTASALEALGWLYLGQDMADKAAAVFEEAIAKNSSRSQVYIGRAQAAERMGDKLVALSAYQAARQLTGPKLSLDIAIARMERLVGNGEGSLALLTQLQRAYPVHYPVYQELKATLLALDRPQDAVPFFQYLVRQNPYVASYWVDLVSLYMRLGDNEGIQSATIESQKARFSEV